MSRDPTESRREAVVGRSRAKNIPGRGKCKGPEVALCSVSLKNIKVNEPGVKGAGGE